MTAVDPVIAMRDAARRAGLACTRTGNLRVAMLPAEYLTAAADEIERLRRDLALAHSAYVVAEQTSLELFAQRNAARDAIARHADGEGR